MSKAGFLALALIVLAGGAIAFAAMQAPGGAGTAASSTASSTLSGGATTTPGIRPYASGIRGTVTLGPTCPVEQNPPLPQCADKPYATTILVSRAGSSVVFATARSGADGTFELSVPPGSYVVSAEGGATLPRCGTASVSVTPTYYAVADLSCDTGIR